MKSSIKRQVYSIYIKGFIDKIISLLLLIAFSPILIISILSLFLFNNGSVFFLQKRPGKGEKIFKIIKFKTMNEKKDSNGNLLPDSKRLTSIGKLIRKTSVDEIPQLLNVLKGDMSLIGPRPLLIEYLQFYNEEQKRRHQVKPGISGWAQVNGRNAISWEKKFELDIEYIEKLSFKFDLKILFLTVRKVFVAEGINAGKSETMQKFIGQKQSL